MACLLGSSAAAQNVSGSLTGSVQDKLGAVLAGAEITLTNAQGFVRTTKTNEAGFFAFPDLTAATFTLAVSAPGFKRWLNAERSYLKPGETRRYTITLQVTDSVGQTSTDTVVVTLDDQTPPQLTVTISPSVICCIACGRAKSTPWNGSAWPWRISSGASIWIS